MTHALNPSPQAPAVAPKQTRRRKESDKQEFRAQLIGIALDLHSRHGSAAVTVRSVAQHAGISPMAMYRYFPSKSALLSHVWEDILMAVQQQCAQAAALHEAPYERLSAWLKAYVCYWLAHRDHFRLVYLESGLQANADVATEFWVHAQGPVHLRLQMQALLDACWAQDGVKVSNPKAVHEQLGIHHTGVLHYLIVNSNIPQLDPPVVLAQSLAQMLRMVRTAPQWVEQDGTRRGGSAEHAVPED